MGAIRIEWSSEARTRLREIFDYYFSVAGIRIADKMMEKIDAKIYRILPHTPRAGQREWSLEEEPQEFRRLIEGNYKIIYYVEDETIRIVDIWDCRRDPETLRDGMDH